MTATATDRVWSYPSSSEDWQAFIDVMHSGQVFECDCKMYYYWLEVLPPKYMNRDVQLPNGETVHADFGFAEGAEVITAFWEKDERFFGCRTNQLNRGW